MAQSKNVYSTILSLPLDLDNKDQSYIFEEVFYEVMSYGNSKSKEERSRWEYVFDFDLHGKVWPKLNPSLKKAFLDMFVGNLKKPSDVGELLDSLKNGDNIYLPKKDHVAYRQWILNNCMDILNPLIDKVQSQDKKDLEREKQDELKRALSMIPLLEKAGYVVTKSGKDKPAAKKAVAKAPAKKAKTK